MEADSAVSRSGLESLDCRRFFPPPRLGEEERDRDLDLFLAFTFSRLLRPPGGRAMDEWSSVSVPICPKSSLELPELLPLASEDFAPPPVSPPLAPDKVYGYTRGRQRRKRGRVSFQLQ